jgi:hypothetical protein
MLYGISLMEYTEARRNGCTARGYNTLVVRRLISRPKKAALQRNAVDAKSVSLPHPEL